MSAPSGRFAALAEERPGAAFRRGKLTGQQVRKRD
jgi:hypothetical protein